VVVLEVLGVALWSVLGVAGAWWLLTGRKMIFELPKGIREGWFLRVLGLLYLLLAAFLIYQVFRGSFYPDGVVFSYVFLAVALAVTLNSRRRQRAGRPS
jgi:hypothetical protein